MTLYLNKFLPILVSPLGVVIALLLVSLIVRRRGPVIVGMVILITTSLPLTANRIWTLLETAYPYQPIESVEKSDAVVVLSGMLSGIETTGGVVSQWGDATDRFFAGIDLLRAKKAPLIIFTRGQHPWDNLPPEGELLAKRAIIMGVPERQILLTGPATKTAEEAGAVKALMEFSGMRRVILVTSSFHMPRALRLFEEAGVKVVPYPTDFRADGSASGWTDWVPSADSFSGTSAGIREWIGRLYYRALLPSATLDQ